MKKWLKITLIVLGIIIVTFPIWIFVVASISFEVHSMQYNAERELIGNEYELTQQVSWRCNRDKDNEIIEPGTKVKFVRVSVSGPPGGFLAFKPESVGFGYTVEGVEDELCEKHNNPTACYEGKRICGGPNPCSSKILKFCKELNPLLRKIE
jgi:hypothetical protein